ncbi:hypothetical protein [Tateyamaria sp.]|uniref:hypothetical protein n=1 Tax=Tateyamaria sp. TaxID=1929288 RepID=UPI003B2192A9
MKVDFELGHTNLIVTACMRYRLLRNQAAYVLATAYWETAHTMEPVKEAFWLSEDWRKENLRYYPWYGRGFVQLTWERNYHKAGAELSVDLITDADKVMEPEISADILVVGSRDGWFTGKKLSDYITLQKSNYRGARRIINGTDKAAAIAEIAREYEEALLAEGYGLEVSPPVVDDRRDGSPPRENAAQSKTLLAQVVQWVGAGGAVSAAWFGGQSDMVQVAVIAGVVAIVVAGVVVFRERLRKWADGDR